MPKCYPEMIECTPVALLARDRVSKHPPKAVPGRIAGQRLSRQAVAHWWSFNRRSPLLDPYGLHGLPLAAVELSIEGVGPRGRGDNDGEVLPGVKQYES